MSGDSDQTFMERVEEIREERAEGKDVEPEELSPEGKRSAWLVGGTFLIFGMIGAAANPTEPVTGFFVVGIFFAGIAWLVGTASGRELMKEISDNMDQQQQQQSTGSSEAKRICSECGWQNPKINNYCHDCGALLQTGNG